MTVTTTTRSNASAVFETNERTFERDVLQRSREIPVVVDFWAPWCGPCRALGPTLERLANAAKGEWVLAKVNVDENPRLSQMFGIQGIPAVKAFRDGKVATEFTGALPETQVRAWLKDLIPSEGDALVEAAAALEAEHPDEAEARYRLALGSEPDNAAALFGLGRLLAMRGDPEAELLLNEVPASSPFFSRAQALTEMTALLAPISDAAALEVTLAATPNDFEARFAQASNLIRQHQYAVAFDQLLWIIQRNRGFRDDGARRLMLAVFAALGDDDSLVVSYRRRLASVLF